MDVVTGAMSTLAPKLLQLLKDEFQLQKGLRKKVEFVSQELESINTALRKVAEVPWDQLDEQVKVWARQIRDSSYDMEDILDTFLVRVESGEPVNHNRLKDALKKMGGLFGKVKARHDIAGAIEDIKKKLQEVADRHAKYKIDEIAAKPAAGSSVDPRLSALYTKVSQLVGINEPRDALIERLCIGGHDVSNEKTKVVSIIGAGGLGKTTLAKVVHDKLKPQFHCAAFVPIGQNPDTKKALRDILIDLDKKRYTNFGLEILDERQLINELREFLGNKRFLVVVDDIWDISTWGIITNAFEDNKLGSIVIVTTRNSQVAIKIGDVYRIKELSDINSKKLFYTRIFGREESFADNKHLEVVSDQIIKKCGGVPLAITTVASLLTTKPIEDWSNVNNSIVFGNEDSMEVKNMMKILSLSYYDLPSHLRTCLLHLSMFPEDYVIEKNRLIWRWIAEGLVRDDKGTGLYELGDIYFHELINRNMILPVEIEGLGLVYGCRVHDMVLHLIRDMAKEEKFVSVWDSEQRTLQQGNIRWLAVQSINEHIDTKSMHIQKIRSFSAMWCPTSILPAIYSFKVLRVLALEGCPGMDAYGLDNLGALVHLRYLGLSHTPIRVLPEQIGHLKFLETLILEKTGVKELPASMAQLTQLLCLHADEKTKVPSWMGNLTSLQQLEIYPGENMDSTRLFVNQLGRLRNLRVLRTRIDILYTCLEYDLGQSVMYLRKIQTALFDYGDKLLTPRHGMAGPVSARNINRFTLRSLRILGFELLCLPAWINPIDVPNLCDLWLFLSDVDQQDLLVLGALGKLSCLSLVFRLWNMSLSTEETSTFTCAGGSFQNLKHCNISAPLKFVSGAMPRLQVLDFRLNLSTANPADTFEFGLGNLPSLQRVSVDIICRNTLAARVDAAEKALRQAIDNHPSRPTLVLHRNAQPDTPTTDEYLQMANQKVRSLIHRYHVRTLALHNNRSSSTRSEDENPEARHPLWL